MWQPKDCSVWSRQDWTTETGEWWINVSWIRTYIINSMLTSMSVESDILNGLSELYGMLNGVVVVQ